MATPYLSQIDLFAFGFAPQGWAACAGQLLPINQNQALFSLLGTTYGGNGTTTFALPDLRGRVPLGFGQGAGLSNYNLGAVGGVETVTLTASQMPAHTHTLNPSSLTATAKCKGGVGNRQTPVGNVPAIEAAGSTPMFSSAAPDANMNGGAVALGGTVTASVVGGGQPHDNREPYLPLNFCISLLGIFPSRP